MCVSVCVYVCVCQCVCMCVCVSVCVYECVCVSYRWLCSTHGSSGPHSVSSRLSQPWSSPAVLHTPHTEREREGGRERGADRVEGGGEGGGGRERGEGEGEVRAGGRGEGRGGGGGW